MPPLTPPRGALLLAAFLPLAGCIESAERRDGVSPYAGNALAANRAIQTIDPWPEASRRTDIAVDARRVIPAVERVEAPRAPGGGPAGGGGFSPAIQTAPGAGAPG